ncbi:MAG: hypothetical protein ACJAVN_000077 [Roseivirga sp.]|jgi:hypothetical protein
MGILILLHLVMATGILAENSEETVLLLEFDKNHSMQSSMEYNQGDDEWFTYSIDRIPYKVLFKKKSKKRFKPKKGDFKNLKSYEWLNENYGWSDNIEFLKGSHDFASKYDKILLFIKSENCFLEVSLIIEIED